MAYVPSTLEGLVEARGIRAIKGGYKPWTLEQYSPMVEGIRTAGARTLEDVYPALIKTGMTGASAGKVLENIGQRNAENILNLNTQLAQVPESYITPGLQAGQTAAMREQAVSEAAAEREARQALIESEAEKNRALEREQMAQNLWLARKGMKQQKKIAEVQSQKSSVPLSDCCFIMNEAGDLTQSVREVRDELFTTDSYIAKGYKRMAKWLVPTMRKNRFVKLMVKAIMTRPIAEFAKKKNPVFIPVCVIWCVMWELYGRI